MLIKTVVLKFDLDLDGIYFADLRRISMQFIEVNYY
jgi:hypothetical protein